jgi:hypothetical protein
LGLSLGVRKDQKQPLKVMMVLPVVQKVSRELRMGLRQVVKRVQSRLRRAMRVQRMHRHLLTRLKLPTPQI